jgi:hypothetical protein
MERAPATHEESGEGLSEQRRAKRQRADEPPKHREEQHKMKMEASEERSETDIGGTTAKRKQPEPLLQEAFVIVRPRGPPLWKIREQEEKERQLKKAKADTIE